MAKVTRYLLPLVLLFTAGCSTMSPALEEMNLEIPKECAHIRQPPIDLQLVDGSYCMNEEEAVALWKYFRLVNKCEYIIEELIK